MESKRFSHQRDWIVIRSFTDRTGSVDDLQLQRVYLFYLKKKKKKQ